MNVIVTVVALVVASNAPRRREALSVDDTRFVAAGAAIAAVVLVVFGAVATPLLDALDVSAPNLRIGLGLVLALVSAHDLVRRPPARGAALDGAGAALVPVAFPVLLRPEVGLLAIAAGADHGTAGAVAAIAAAMASVVGWHALAARSGPGGSVSPVFRRVERALGVTSSALAAVCALAIAADGVFAI